MRDRIKARLTLLVGAAVLLLAACGGGDSAVSPGPDTTPPTVSADPAGGAAESFPEGVALTAVDGRDPSPIVYYTTDASTPTEASAVYDGTPIPVAVDTVLKFFARDQSDNACDVVTECYVPTGGFSIKADWAASGHGDLAAEAWRHWDAEGEVGADCAKCHSAEGFVDYAEDGTVDAAAPLPRGLACDGCHQPNIPLTLWGDLETYPAMAPVAFPSGDEVSLQDDSNLCMSCHQGRASSLTVDEAIADAPGGPHAFINIHYFAAAATNFGSEVRGGYQYAGMDYVPRNTFPSHAPELSTCVGCHMQGSAKDHTFVPELLNCTPCHGGDSFETLGGTPVSNHAKILQLEQELLTAIQAHADAEVGKPIVYSEHAYPYFFNDLDGNGEVDAGEDITPNRYVDFDDALLKAAYNYQVSRKDPNGFIHNGTYILQLLHDAIVDLGGTPGFVPPGRTGFAPAGLTPEQRASAEFRMSGHSRADLNPFRVWDTYRPGPPGNVPRYCARCHASTSFADYATDEYVDEGVPAIEVVECRACHVNLDLFHAGTETHYDVQSEVGSGPVFDVRFPASVRVSLDDNSNLCMVCHQGKESGLTIVNATENGAVQSPVNYPSYSFVQRHYYPAVGTFFGSDVNAGYEYPGQSYKGRNTYTPAHGDLVTCIGCHMRGTGDHSFEVRVSDCATCHTNITDFDDLGVPFGGANVDWDGNGTAEGFKREIDGMAANLLAAIQDYALNTLPSPSPIIYYPIYPFYFNDSNEDGQADPNEAIFPNQYKAFDATLLGAAYNFHAARNKGGGMHNYPYVLQTLYDSLDMLDNGVLDASAQGSRP